jgi:3-oxoadipate enol-lactonase
MASNANANFLTLSDGRVIGYELSKSPQPLPNQPLVLLSNSLCAPFPSWDKVVSVLHSRGFGVLRYDQPGHGSSSAPEQVSLTSFDSLTDDVAHLLKHLDISKLDAWIGVSMGAATGVFFAKKNPGFIKKLFVCDCPTSSTGLRNAFTPRAEAAKEAGNMDAVVEGTANRWFSESWRSQNPEELKWFTSIMKTTQVDGFRACVEALISDSFDMAPIAPELHKYVESVAIIVGELDMNLPQTMASLRDTIQQGFNESGNISQKVNFDVVKGAGHVCYIDNFEGFTSAVLQGLGG